MSLLSLATCKFIDELPLPLRKVVNSLIKIYDKLSRPGQKTITGTQNGKTNTSGFRTENSNEWLLTKQVKVLGQPIVKQGASDQGNDGFYLLAIPKKMPLIAPDEPIAMKGRLNVKIASNILNYWPKVRAKPRLF